MKSVYALPFAVASLLLAVPVAHAADSAEEEDLTLVYGDKSTISIATGSKQKLRRAPAVATVITAEDIAAMGAVDLDDVLETVPGIHVSNAPNTYSSLYLIRGIYSGQNPQTLLLQNGVPMTTLFQGNKGNIWGGYPVENIARIEIIRGPGSALYGADAYSGVINIITKTAADQRGTRAGLRAGSFGTRSAWAQHGGTAGDIDVSAYLQVGSTDGHKRIIEADAQTARDLAAGTRASLAPGPVNVGYDAVDAQLALGYEKWRANVGYKLRDDLGTGAGISSALDPVGKEKSERFNTDLSWTDAHLANGWGGGVTASYFEYRQRIPVNLQLFPPGTVLPTGSFPQGMIGHPDTSERQLRLSAFATYSGFENHSLRFGVGHDDLNLYETRTFKNYIFNPAGVPVPTGRPVEDYSTIQPFMLPQRRKINYLYVQDEWQFARDWALTAGVRHDRYSDFGGTTNPRLALVWDAALDLTAKLLYGRAFRAPSFSEQYSINNPVQRGNADLNPETINTLEAAFSWQARRDLQLNLSIFRYNMDDIIRATPNPAPVLGSTFNNAGGQHGRGMELEAVWDASRTVRLSGNYSYQRSIDETTGTDAGYAPHHHLYTRADWRLTTGWLASTQLNWVADRKRAAGDTRPPIADYKTVDLSLRTSRGKGQWEFGATVRNLFNADAREPSPAPGLIPNDLPLAPRALYLQAAYSM
ncbi:TonB-dependent receptor plug domain-containing protein [Noviherbaspirillum saxi]|uniref:TonB-dependent receptor n=1 Tax=Noviherbaspirillum saxi TaxID=2320863 RepID=A0A3A3FNZ1_9BURK|nr:TonB-dependent receptor [Noviherbaspirillum saxi]RJF97603.1 TonB-dependent receptor [Noviherbaspirillum saxi]